MGKWEAWGSGIKIYYSFFFLKSSGHHVMVVHSRGFARLSEGKTCSKKVSKDLEMMFGAGLGDWTGEGSLEGKGWTAGLWKTVMAGRWLGHLT